jgi:hypothetical protein
VSRFRINPDRSQVWIDARSNLHGIHSQAGGLLGYVELDVGGGGIDLTMPPSGQVSFPVSNLKSGNGLEDREMLRRIEARKFATIDGVLVELTAGGGSGRYRVSGDVTFRGTVRRCEDFIDIEVIDAGEAIRIAGQSTFDVRDFGMDPPRILVLRVEPRVAVRVEIFAEKEASGAGRVPS